MTRSPEMRMAWPLSGLRFDVEARSEGLRETRRARISGRKDRRYYLVPACAAAFGAPLDNEVPGHSYSIASSSISKINTACGPITGPMLRGP